jgi:hypothetical protein
VAWARSWPDSWQSRSHSPDFHGNDRRHSDAAQRPGAGRYHLQRHPGLGGASHQTSTRSHTGKPIQAHSYYDRINGELLGTLVHPTFTITGQTVRERVVFVYVRYGEPVTVAMPAAKAERQGVTVLLDARSWPRVRDRPPRG